MRPTPGSESAEVRNPFTGEAVARRYVQGRPFYHRAALQLVDRPPGRVGLAVDVACGTGLSSRAVRERADQVIALDASAAMLRSAEQIPGVHYVAATAERLPLPDAIADLATVGAAFHWFDQGRAIAELARVLRPGAGLVVYTDAFHGKLVGRDSFTDWLTQSYLPSVPGPARHQYFDPEIVQALGFTAAEYVEGEIQVPLTRSQLADYLLSQSNAAAAIEFGQLRADTLRAQIIAGITPFIQDDDPVDAVFGIRVWTTTLRA
jgi:SAM-dependent methyltransferase